jgi:GTP cyclohydrolase I
MEKIQNSIKTIIQECKIKHENIDEVAKKASEKMIQNFSGYGVDVAGLFSNKIKNEHRYNNAIEFLEIPFISYCYHHMSPIIGHVNIKYTPNQWLIGLSKITECVYAFANRLQIQENMTVEIGNAIIENLQAKSVTVEIVAKHYCMQKIQGQHLPAIKTSFSK